MTPAMRDLASEAAAAESGSSSAPLLFLSSRTREPVRWTEDRVVRRICERRRAGLRVNYMSVRREAPSLLGAARRLFGGWSAALRAADVSLGAMRLAPPIYARHPRPPPKNPDDLIPLLRERLRLGLPLTCHAPELKEWYDCARQAFGSWRRVRELAGDPSLAAPAPTREQLLDILRQRARDGLPLNASHPDLGRYHGAARRLFGSWTRLREAAGCEPRHPYTADEVVSALIAALDARRPLLIRDPALLPYVSAARRHFGGWSAAVRRARSLRLARARRSAPIEGFPKTREGIIALFRSRVERGLSLDAKLWELSPYRHAAIRLFGSWAEARAAAGAPFVRFSFPPKGSGDKVVPPHNAEGNNPCEKA